MKTARIRVFLLSVLWFLGCDSSEIKPELSPVIAINRSEVVLSAGENSNAPITDTVEVTSNIDWTLINGSPTSFKVERIERDNKFLLAISADPNTELIEKVGKVIIYGDDINPLEITLRQQPATRVYEITGTSEQGYQDGDFSSAVFGSIWTMTYHAPNNSLYVADSYNFKIRKVDLINRVVTTLPGIYGSLYGICSNGYGEIFAGGSSLIFRKISNEDEITDLSWETGDIGILVTESYTDGPIYYIRGNSIYKTARDENYSALFAGAEAAGFSDGVGQNARFNFPTGLCMARNNNGIYVLDLNNYSIRQISNEGVVSTLMTGHGLRDGTIEQAQVSAPLGITVMQDGTIYFIDGHEVRKIDTNNVVSTLELVGDDKSEHVFRAIHAFGNTLFLSTATKIYTLDAE